MGQIVTFPFITGLQSGTDKAVLPDGSFADIQNLEMDRNGRLRVRARFVAQPVTSYAGGSLVAYDLFTLNDRLFVIGDATAYGFPSDVFEFVVGAAAAWRATSDTDSVTPRLPRASKVRDICRPPDQPGGISQMGCTAFAGYAALGWNSADDKTLGYVQVVKASDNQPVLLTQLNNSGSLPCRRVRVIGLSDRLIVVGVNSANTQIGADKWVPLTDTTLTNLSTTLLTAAQISTYAVCKVGGTDQFMIISNLNGTVRVRRYNNAAVLQAPSGGQYADVTVTPVDVAVEADLASNQINIGMTVSGELRIFSYNLSTGANIGTGPFVPFPGDTVQEFAFSRVTTNFINILASVSSGTQPTIKSIGYTVSTNIFTSVVVQLADGALTTTVQQGTPEFFFGMRQGTGLVGNTPNMIMAAGLTGRDVTPQVVKDLEVAGTVVSDSNNGSKMLPELARDASTGKYYWCNATANPDGDLAPQITEFDINSTDRRQTAQIGNSVYISGGCPVVFDGINMVESGFLTRPRILTLTSGFTAGGNLLQSAAYDYRVHAEWVDSESLLHSSPPSGITTVTLSGATDNSATGFVSTHHSMRLTRSIGFAGSQVRYILSRTEASLVKTSAILSGTQFLDPPISSLNGLTLVIVMVDSSPTTYTVTFTAGATSSSAVVTQVNAVTTGHIVASSVGGFLVLTSVEQGVGVSMRISTTSTAKGVLGFVDNQASSGTTTAKKGQNFQRAANAYTQANLSLPIGTGVTIVDTRKDESSPIVDSDLIRQPVLYSQGSAVAAHFAPPPFQYCWAGRERVVVAGTPDPSVVVASKTQVPAEPIEFASAGFVAFSKSLKGDIKGVAVLGDAIVVWTRREIWMISGSGPNRAGQGEFFAASRISAAGGMIDDGWRSIVETDEGLFFQLSGDKIYLLTKAGTLTWIGREAQDYLDLFPVVTAAVHSIRKHSVIFSVTNAAKNDGGLLRYDLENKAWFFDSVGAVTSLAEYGDQIAYIQGGVVYIQDATPGAGTFVSYLVKSNMFQGFGSLGWGGLNKVGFLGTYQGDCTVEGFISYDGLTYTSLGTYNITSAEYTIGQRVVRLWDPTLQKVDQFSMKFVVTGTTNSEGVWIHAYALDVEHAPELSRQGASHNK